MKYNPEMIYFHDNPFHGLIKVKEPIKMQEKCPGSSYVIFSEAKTQFISCTLPTVNNCDYIRPQLPGIHKKNVWHKLWISIFWVEKIRNLTHQHEFLIFRKCSFCLRPKFLWTYCASIYTHQQSLTYLWHCIQDLRFFFVFEQFEILNIFNS